MSGLLEGHIAAVTGAGSGIGRAIALGYAREGARVVVLDVNAEAAARDRQIRLDAGGKAAAWTLDVTDRVACRQRAAEIADKVGQVSILVNNAGINRRNAFTAEPDAVIKDWQDIIGHQPQRRVQRDARFLEQLRATKGRIVNIGSIQSFMHVRTPNSPAYTTSKHGVLGFTRALAAELGKDGVRVNAIGPGLIETPLNAAGARQQSGADQDLHGPHAARPRRQAGGHRRPGDLPRLRPVGLRHRLRSSWPTAATARSSGARAACATTSDLAVSLSNRGKAGAAVLRQAQDEGAEPVAIACPVHSPARRRAAGRRRSTYKAGGRRLPVALFS